MGGFWALTPPVWSNIAEILTRGRLWQSKTLFEKFLKDSTIHGKGADPKPGVVACTCNPATLEAEFWNGMSSIPVGGNSPSIGWWIV